MNIDRWACSIEIQLVLHVHISMQLIHDLGVAEGMNDILQPSNQLKTIEVRRVRLIKTNYPGSGTHCFRTATPKAAFHLTFSRELTQHITARLIKWICFRSSALTPIFQGSQIRSAVTEECLLNKNWCITSWKAGGRWAFSRLHAADPDLCFTQCNMLDFIMCWSRSAKLRGAPLGLSFDLCLLICSTVEAHIQSAPCLSLYIFLTDVELVLASYFCSSFSLLIRAGGDRQKDRNRGAEQFSLCCLNIWTPEPPAN